MWRDAWILSALLLGLAFLGTVQAPQDADTGRLVFANAWLTSHLVLLAGGCLLHARWRTTGEPAMGWLAAVFLVPTFPLVPVALLRMTEQPPAWTDSVREPFDLLAALPTLAMAVLAVRKAPFPRALNPIGLASAVGLTCLAGALAAAILAPAPPGAATHVASVIAVSVGGVMVCRLRWLRRLHRAFLALAAGGVAAAHDFHAVTTGPAAVPDDVEFLAAGITVVSASALVVLTLGLFRRALDLKARRAAEYQARAETAEEALRREEELLHEVRATMAGISTATYVLHGRIPMQRQVSEHHLRSMLDTEVARVQRLLRGEASGPPLRIELDELLLPQVVAQRTLGHDVRWEPAGIAAFGHADKLAEAVHVVLTNATRYAAGGLVEVRTDRRDGMVTITVTDSGPGVSPEMRGALFDRGAHDERSPGLGVGLYLAQRSVREDGGSIRLQDSPQPGTGATLVISLRAALLELS
jgi:signal transduction histidine kinase